MENLPISNSTEEQLEFHLYMESLFAMYHRVHSEDWDLDISRAWHASVLMLSLHTVEFQKAIVVRGYQD